MWTILILIPLTILLGIAAWLIFMWAVRSGQYEDIEGPKYRMLDDEDEEIKASLTSTKRLHDV
ncbi:MAG: cbb3-type cytochrome oxidase assembly protein CcoS [Thermodesulfovibrionales bacterium]|nr:cbb3-type cytochrome oxidase assembly protein CcoS [Thermodesulfovibrionales bacterium]